MSFRGPCFYSYSTVIARHIERNGQRAVIINQHSFSNTTAKHQNHVWRALDTETVFYFDAGMNTDLNPSGKELFEFAIAKSVEEAGKASKARQRKAYHHSQQASWLARAKGVSNFFGLRRKVDEKTIERLRESAVKAEREYKAKMAKQDALARLQQTEAYDAWLRGEHATEGAQYFNVRLFPVAFRIEGDELVSTLGARVPLADARRAFAFVLTKKAEGWSRNGVTMRVGHYQLDSIGGEGVKAGCHTITWDEIERLTSILL